VAECVLQGLAQTVFIRVININATMRHQQRLSRIVIRLPVAKVVPPTGLNLVAESLKQPSCNLSAGYNAKQKLPQNI